MGKPMMNLPCIRSLCDAERKKVCWVLHACVAALRCLCKHDLPFQKKCDALRTSSLLAP